ncbi:hypothetical protein [Chromatium okenii]|uniref:hypothetical protein n=1 Tax=Chromatium okenii TaxID=61644 RepID=UPI001F5BDD06|nr:hypothetical protein [Chromatium okenii]
MDLQGPKIRIGKFTEGKIELMPCATFAIDSACAIDAGDSTQVGTTYLELANESLQAIRYYLMMALLN